jgi:hypothetical protein
MLHRTPEPTERVPGMLFVVKTVRTNLKAPRSLLEIHLCNDGGEYSGVVKRLRVWFLILVTLSNQ